MDDDERDLPPLDAARLTERALGLLERIVAGKGGGGERRQPQVDMVAAVCKAIATDSQAVVQAGCGVGKSLAYLSAVASAPGRRSVVITTSLSLQDQLATKDLPALAAAMDHELSYAVIKGKSNYACWAKIAELSGEKASDPSQGALELGEAALPVVAGAERSEIDDLIEWAHQSKTGDKAELPFEPSHEAWAAVSTTSDQCPGADHCPRGDVCFAVKARDEAQEADIIVVNAHLYGAHIACGSNLLPVHEVLVCDEAHDVEDAITGAFGIELSPARLGTVASAVTSAVGKNSPGANALRAVAAELASVLAPLAGKTLPRGLEDRVLVNVTSSLLAAADTAQREVRSQKDRAKTGRKPNILSRCERALTALDGLRRDIEGASEDLAGAVCWVEQSGNGRHVLKVAPIEIGPLLKTALWPYVRSGILCSATLPQGIPPRLGVYEAERLDVGSPFDYANNGRLYVPAGLPSPKDQDAHGRAVIDELERLIVAAGGRTLALFTSHANLQAATAAIRERLGDRFPVLAQNEHPKQVLIDRFTNEPETCLFATASFRQGVDVPGDSCAVVVLDRIPFPRPDDPLMQARRARAGQSAFQTVDLPWSAAQLAQGAGRLIRTATDRGVVAILDPRLADAQYRDKLLAALPPLRRTRTRNDVVEFLRQPRPATVPA